MDVERTSLPGIGLQHVFTTSRGRQVGVVSHRTGRRDLAVYDKQDPDTCIVTVQLTAEEAGFLAELLGTGKVVERLNDLHKQVEGLVTEQVPIAAGSPYDGRTLGDTRARSRTGASIVAVVRNAEVIASPRPGFVFSAGDKVVVVGTAEGTAAVARIFASG
ncbi:cation:proton antiporter regulatory subunit [Thermomonospora cellulosilytica]|uniref:TrkA domain protein n=1 Tax=Thermomonospora cellulosilytica TaxID=1411118 RepID=A0A7W3R789_9ACTN|nr:cation:proton antiporter regulatory subunit [Thermomonospora cellulosilytica]MBA9002234.1 TrkA domain protein [Thermomonospora cellulosilytica]